MNRLWLEDVRQGEWHGVFKEERVHGFDCTLDGAVFISAAAVRESDKRCVEPFLGPGILVSFEDVVEGRIQEMKIAPWLVRIHL